MLARTWGSEGSGAFPCESRSRLRKSRDCIAVGDRLVVTHDGLSLDAPDRGPTDLHGSRDRVHGDPGGDPLDSELVAGCRCHAAIFGHVSTNVKSRAKIVSKIAAYARNKSTNV